MITRHNMKVALMAGAAGALISTAAFAADTISSNTTTTSTSYNYGAAPVIQPQTAPVVVQQEYTYTRTEREVPVVAHGTYEREGATVAPSKPLRAEPQAEVNPHGIRFMSGGVGADEQARFKAAEAEYPVKFVFASSGGAFMSDVNVTVTDKAGETVLGMMTDGPILLMDLEPGSYTVKADDHGQVQTRDITVSDSSNKTYTLHFKAMSPQDYSLNAE